MSPSNKLNELFKLTGIRISNMNESILLAFFEFKFNELSTINYDELCLNQEKKTVNKFSYALKVLIQNPQFKSFRFKNYIFKDQDAFEKRI